jgi:hypothetical protein
MQLAVPIGEFGGNSSTEISFPEWRTDSSSGVVVPRLRLASQFGDERRSLDS